MFYVYILKSETTSKRYIGYSTDLKRRILEHNNKKCRSTSFDGPWELVYYEAFKLENDARREEIFLKTGKGRERIKFLFNSYQSGVIV